MYCLLCVSFSLWKLYLSDVRGPSIGVNTRLRPHGKALMAGPGIWCAIYKQTPLFLLSVFLFIAGLSVLGAGHCPRSLVRHGDTVPTKQMPPCHRFLEKSLLLGGLVTTRVYTPCLGRLLWGSFNYV